MPTNNGNGRRGNRGRGRNNNPEGRNQYSGVMGAARANPIAAAATVGGAVAAGVFLWSRRSQVSEQIEGLAAQVGEWREGMTSARAADEDVEAASGTEARSQREIAEEALTLKETGAVAS